MAAREELAPTWLPGVDARPVFPDAGVGAELTDCPAQPPATTRVAIRIA
jgi:hypothetical protein